MITTRPLIRIGPGVFPRHLVAGKLLAMVLLGAGLGYLLGLSMAADAAKGAALTLDDYVAEFETYRAGLVDSAMPVGAVVVIGILMVVGALILYEALSVLLSWGVAWLMPQLPSEAPAEGSEASRA